MPQKTSAKKSASPKPYPEGGKNTGAPNRVAESVAIHFGLRLRNRLSQLSKIAKSRKAYAIKSAKAFVNTKAN